MRTKPRPHAPSPWPLGRGVSLALLCVAFGVHAQINSWTNPISGNWQDPHWSLGALPNASQSEVRLVNPGSKAVAIQPGTATGFSNSMTVFNLRLAGIGADTNLLLLNYAGTSVPLRVINDFTIHTNARVLMLYSALDVNNHLNVDGVFDQEGGALYFTNATLHVDGRYTMTNGFANGFDLHIGGTGTGVVDHYNGVIWVTSLILGYNANSEAQGDGVYVLRDGWLLAAQTIGVGGWGQGELRQSGGTNSSARMNISLGKCLKTAGGLFTDVLHITAGVASWGVPFEGTFSQSGGTTLVTNAVELFGYATETNSQVAKINLTGGTFWTQSFALFGGSVAVQSNCTVYASNLYVFDAMSAIDTNGYNLFCGNLYTANTHAYSFELPRPFNHYGGAHIVANEFTAAGAIQYNFQGGTLSAPKLYIGCQFTVGGTVQPNAITNSDYIILAQGTLTVPVSQRFGGLFLFNTSQLDFGHASSTVRFGDSRNNPWSPNWTNPQRLRILNWSGSTNGGGTDRLIFGTNNSALTAEQLAHIHFVDGAGRESRARILETGEVVPAPAPELFSRRVGNQVVLTWNDFAILQFSTNVAGPYQDILSATSPYTNAFVSYSSAFFRLRD